MHKLTKAIAITAAILSFATPSFAAQSAFEDLFSNAFYGGLAGSLVGAAVLAFADKPGDHLEYIAQGAAIGIIAGAAYSAVTATRSFAEVGDGTVKFAIPTVVPQIRDLGRGRTEVVATASLVRGRF